MTRDVLIRISGIQMVEGDSDNVEVITAGNYFLRNGKHYILYDEMAEGFTGVIKNTIKISEQGMDIRKSGANNAHMVFEPAKKSIASYATPLGEMMIGISTSEIFIDEAEDKLQVKVSYSLDINYNHVSECELVLTVSSRNKTDLNLLS